MNSFSEGRKASFRNALRGIYNVILSQVNFRIHLSILSIVIIAGLALRITLNDWVAIILAVGLVLTAECLNTAVEFLGDACTKEFNPFVGKAKDAAAAGVLIASITAAVVGLIVFIPALLRFMN